MITNLYSTKNAKNMWKYFKVRYRSTTLNNNILELLHTNDRDKKSEWMILEREKKGNLGDDLLQQKYMPQMERQDAE